MRPEIEAYFRDENVVVDANNAVRSETVVLGEGKYTLTIFQYRTKQGCWNFTRGIVRQGAGQHEGAHAQIADVKRNYSRFWHAYIEHPNGHDYLLCGEDYQGQTVIELDTGERRDYLPKQAEQGFGFCWASAEPIGDNTKIEVEGCIWAGPFEVVTFDFSEPLNLPYRQLSSRWLDYDDDDDEDDEVEKEPK